MAITKIDQAHNLKVSQEIMSNLTVNRNAIKQFKFGRLWKGTDSEIEELCTGIDKFIDNDNIKDYMNTLQKNDPENKEVIKTFENLLDGNDSDLVAKLYKDNTDTFSRFKDEYLIYRNFLPMKEIINQIVTEMLAPDDFTKEVMYIVKKSDGSDIVGFENCIKEHSANKYLKDALTDMCVHGRSYIMTESISSIINAQLTNNKENENTTLSEVSGYYNYKELFSDESKLLEHEDNFSILSEATSLTDINDKVKNKFKKRSMSNTNESTLLGTTNVHVNNKEKTDIKGSYIKLLTKRDIIPIKVGDSIPGYVYISNKNKERLKGGGTTNRRYNETNRDNDISFISDLSNEIIKNLNLDFLDVNSKYKREIATILKEEQIENASDAQYTFIPSDKIIELSTCDGESSFESAIPFAKIYIYLFYTKILLKCSREHDQRIYYFKNINTGGNKTSANALSKSLKELEFNRFNITALNDLNRSLLQRAGRTGDMHFCTNEGEERPFGVDIIEGQRIEMDMDLFEKLERIIINSMGVPSNVSSFLLEDVNFAKELSMINGKYLRSIVSLQHNNQSEIKDFFNILCVNDGILTSDETITLTLPISQTLMTEIGSDNLRSLTDTAETLGDLLISENDPNKDELLREFKLMFVTEHSQFKIGDLNKILDKAKLNISELTIKQSEMSSEEDTESSNNNRYY